MVTIKVNHLFPDSEYRTYKKGEQILRTGAKKLGHILAGTVLVTAIYGDETEVKYTIRKGEWLGVETYGPGMFSQITWEALTDCTVALTSIQQLDVSNSTVKTSLISSLARQKTSVLVRTIVCDKPACRRIEVALMELAKSEGEEISDGILIPVLNRTELAAAANTGREYVSRHLSRLVKLGNIELRNRGVLIKTDLTLEHL